MNFLVPIYGACEREREGVELKVPGATVDPSEHPVTITFCLTRLNTFLNGKFSASFQSTSSGI